MNLERFQELVDRTTKEGDCWVYPSNTRYAQVRIKGTRKSIGVHRLAWICNFGDIPKGHCVCHECDNPHCINPEHLWLGTNQENTADKVAKDRQARGAKVSWAYSNLTAVDVQEIRELHEAGIPRKIIMRLYPVKKSNYYNIVNKVYWQHV